MSPKGRPARPIPPIPEPWDPGQATDRIRWMASQKTFKICPKIHALERMEERSITTLDMIHALKHGFVYDAPENAKQPGLYKYTVVGLTPNSNGRNIKVVLIPSMHAPTAKIITVMWADEQ